MNKKYSANPKVCSVLLLKQFYNQAQLNGFAQAHQLFLIDLLVL